MKLHQASSAAAIILSMLVTACGGGGGGGGGGNNQLPVTTSAQGAYEGETSNDLSHNTIVLDDDQFYTLYGLSFDGILLVLSFLQGSGKSNNGSYSSTDVRDYNYTHDAIPGTLSASYTPSVDLNGSLINAKGDTITFTSTPINKALYNYNAAANVANLAGAWSLDLARADVVNPLIIRLERANLNVTPGGEITGSFAIDSSLAGCSFDGSAQARTSGKNVFDVALTFGGAPCLAPGQTVRGIALEHPLANGKQQLIIAGANADRDFGVTFSGTR